MGKLVSIIMSTFNESETHLKEAIESILNQTYKNYEFIIVLDNPENNLHKKILQEYREFDKRIIIIYNEENIGLAKSLNRAILETKGEYIARMDADDISDLERIRKQVEYIEKFGFDMITSNLREIDENGEALNNSTALPRNHQVNKILPFTNFIAHSSVMIKSKVILKLNGYRDFDNSQDYDLWLRVLSAGYSIGILDESLINYRIRKNSITAGDKYKQHLTSKYQKKLFKMRLISGEDDFSKLNYDKFLMLNNYYDERKNRAFNDAYNQLLAGMVDIKDKHVITGIFKITKAIVISKEVLNIIERIVKYNVMVKNY